MAVAVQRLERPAGALKLYLALLAAVEMHEKYIVLVWTHRTAWHISG